jgi:hypothetical protein
MKQTGVLRYFRCLLMVTIILTSAFNAYCQTTQGNTGIDIPIGGNSWLLEKIEGEEITNQGFMNWQNSGTICRTFFRISEPGTIHTWLFIESPDTGSVLQVTIGKVSKKIPMSKGHGNRIDVGTWIIKDTGYLHIDVRASGRKNPIFGKLTSIRIEGPSVLATSSFVQNNDDNYFYWGRRGPSVHLNYKVDTGFKVSWFYSEIIVPAGKDIIGSYFMANGFAEGYYGMQVNSNEERRILFSIWSPYNTDDPESIPDSLKIKLLAKGKDVHTGEFGNEGSGGQSYLRYNWKAGTRYGFLTHAEPHVGNRTTYSSWFFDPEAGRWMLIARFQRPSTYTHLKRLHSFLENFEPETGSINRKGLFSSQFIADEIGEWKEINEAVFSIDQTGRKNYRKDFYGGVDRESFVLKNCGFFSNYQLPGTLLTRSASGKRPVIDFGRLPTE